jgi:hypothetical protein
VSKKLVSRASESRKSLEAHQFFKLASQLRESKKPAERQRLKKQLARITFGG